GLNAAVRATLQKPTGPLSSQDLLSLTELNACCRNVSSVEGLEAARNLATLYLQSNRLANLTVPSKLTNLTTVDLRFNPLTNGLFPDGLTKLTRVLLKSSQLTNLTLPDGLSVLIELDLGSNRFTSFNVPSNMVGVGVLD
uniref:hypothetical protein n=1 Tax=Klebsiella pneumoniae TaxID=573 RepID=UPI003D36C893